MKIVRMALFAGAALFLAGEARAGDVQQRLDDARKESQRLQSQLTQKKNEAQGLFTQVNQAESAAGLSGQPCTLMETGPVQTPPPSGAVYAKLRVRRAAFQMTISFADTKPRVQS